MKEICVVHLVRASNGIKPFQRFLESYRINPGGIEHDLMIVFKGFDHQNNTQEYCELLKPYDHITFHVLDEGYDITAYFTVTKCYSEHYQYFCFLNSFSIIQDYEWLRKLYENISKLNVGLVGATGCWNSNNTNARAWFNGLPEEIRSKKDIKSWKNIEVAQTNESIFYKLFAYWKAVVYLSGQILKNIYFLIHYNPFPNYHLRTNTFMISGKDMCSLEKPNIKSKRDAYKFESGKLSLTLQIIKMGKKPLIVGKDGIGYEKELWNKSRTLWSFEQENLLVADNQTMDYQNGTKEKRRTLSLVAWGKVY